MINRISDGVVGWRGRLGWICPSVHSSIADVDFHSVVPEGIELKTVSLGITTLTYDQAEMALSKLDDAAAIMANAGVSHITVMGTPLVTSKGFGFDKVIIDRVEKIAKLPATTDLTAAVDALRALHVKKLLVVSPQTYEIDQRIEKFMKDSGFDVLYVKSLNMKFNREIRALPRSAAYTAASEGFAQAPSVEGVYIACGEWCPPWVIEALEEDLGIPVIHAQQASTWVGLQTLRMKEPVKGWGRVFDLLPKS